MSTFPASPEAPNDAAQIWDAEVSYDRYAVDTTLLNNRDIILRLADEPGLQLPENKSNAVREVMTLLDDRYAELVYGEDEKSNSVTVKLLRLEQEWKKRYLYPRIEKVGVDKYDDWVEMHSRTVGLDDDAVIDWGDARHLPPFWMALDSIDLVPIWGLRLIVPPDVEVTDKYGNATLYRWDDVDTAQHVALDIFPSTRERLREAKLFDPEFKNTDLHEQSVALSGLKVV